MRSRLFRTALALALAVAVLPAACTEQNPLADECSPVIPCPDGQRCTPAGTCEATRAGCASAADCTDAGGERACCAGACIDTTNNLTHCGGCGLTCLDRAHADIACRASDCVFVACKPGWSDCDGDVTNGCEADLASAQHCGACNNTCADSPDGTGTCKAGVCQRSCKAGYADCDKDASNGCEVMTTTDPAHCGGCGKACPPIPNGTNTCIAGVCTPAKCGAGFGDCNGDPKDGCETPLSTPDNCGACGSLCPAQPNSVATCDGGKCGLDCAFGFGDCDQMRKNGCEADLQSLRACGKCGNACKPVPNGTPACNLGQCGVGACNPLFGDCDRMPGNGCEQDLAADLANCGACGSVCAVKNGRPACLGGKCGVVSCNAGFADCDKAPGNGCEASILGDARNCGACGKACPMGDACVQGACTCPNCAKAFPHSAARCAPNDQCVWSACHPGWADCNKNTADGCEVDVDGDEANCGACGNVCPMNAPVCLAGACVVDPCNGSPLVEGLCWVKPTAQMVTHAAACKSIGKLPTDKLVDIRWDDSVLTAVADHWGWASIGDFNDSAHAMWCDVAKRQCGTHNFGAPFNNYGPWDQANWWPVYTCVP